MLEKCLNPACSTKFRNLRDGRVFVKELEDASHDRARHGPHQPVYFWLCDLCCRTMTVVAEKGKVRAMQASAPIRPLKPKNRDRSAG